LSALHKEYVHGESPGKPGPWAVSEDLSFTITAKFSFNERFGHFPELRIC